MKLLNVLLVLVLVSNNALGSKTDNFSRIPFYILNAASAYDIDADLMYAICSVESKCKARALNRNDGTPEEKAAGIKVKSYGLFQIKVSTAEMVGFVSKTVVTTKKWKKHKEVTETKTVDNSDELLNPITNSLYAAKLLAKLYKKYHSTEKVISAYNAGHYIKSNQDYVFKVLKRYAELKIDKRH